MLVFETSGHASLAAFDSSGAAYARRIGGVLRGANLAANPRILDWGSGAGRILAHMPDALAVPVRLHACDPNPRAIAHIRRAFPDVAAALSSRLPPAPYADAAFDAIYGVSIFTHLSHAAAQAWAGELARLLASDGVVVVTTHGAHAAARLTPAQRARFDAGDYVELGGARVGSRTYVSYLNEAAGRRLFATGFGEVAFHPAPGDEFNQDIWLLRAPRRPLDAAPARAHLTS
jgi:SAM-dependent methyltransferase